MSCSSVCNAPEFTRRKLLAAALAAAAVPRAAQARSSDAPPEVAKELAEAKRIGQGRLRYFGLHIYDATLWSAANSSELSLDAHALGLELRYARNLDGAAIAERSLKEMHRVGEVPAADGQRWLQDMQRLFPDVVAGDRLTGIHRPGETARFYLNGKLRGEVRDAAFTRLFFGIWLSPQTSQPQLRLALLGRS
jgi:Chalcone isomerase-like